MVRSAHRHLHPRFSYLSWNPGTPRLARPQVCSPPSQWIIGLTFTQIYKIYNLHRWISRFRERFYLLQCNGSMHNSRTLCLVPWAAWALALSSQGGPPSTAIYPQPPIEAAFLLPCSPSIYWALLCSRHCAKPGRCKGELDPGPSQEGLTISERDSHINTVQFDQRERCIQGAVGVQPWSKELCLWEEGFLGNVSFKLGLEWHWGKFHGGTCPMDPKRINALWTRAAELNYERRTLYFFDPAIPLL